MINDENNNIEFAEEATERYNLIQDMIREYIKEFDVLRFKLSYNKEENKEIKFGGFVEYNVIRPEVS